MVLDEQHRQLEAVARRLDERREPLDLLVAEAARRLVEEQEPRLGDEGARELDPLQRPVGKPGGRALGEVLDLDVLEDLARAGAGMPARVGADEDVLEDGHRREELDVLERARDAPAHDLVRRRAEQALAVERDLARLGPVEARDDVEGGRLAGAVGADQAGDLALLHRERDVVEGDDAAEAARDVAELEERRHQARP